MADPEDITLKIVLDHIQALGQSLRTQIHRLEKRLDRVERRMDRLQHRMDDIEHGVNGLNQKMNHRFDLITLQIDNLDKRLDAIEIEQIPKTLASHDRRIRKLEKRYVSSASRP